MTVSEQPQQFARRVLSMPEQVALGYLRAWHDSTCECGDYDAQGGPAVTLESMRRHWAGRLT